MLFSAAPLTTRAHDQKAANATGKRETGEGVRAAGFEPTWAVKPLPPEGSPFDLLGILAFGGHRRDRTADLLLMRQPLFH